MAATDQLDLIDQKVEGAVGAIEDDLIAEGLEATAEAKAKAAKAAKDKAKDKPKDKPKVKVPKAPRPPKMPG